MRKDYPNTQTSNNSTVRKCNNNMSKTTTSPSSINRTTASWNAPQPPAHILQPLYQLDEYLQSQDADCTTNPNVDEILNVAEFLYGNNTLTSALSVLDSSDTNITKISSNHQSLFLVKGSSSESYLCLSQVGYCSCRSFYEKTTKSTSFFNSTRATSTANHKAPPPTVSLCKHLLALKLLPYLQVPIRQLTTATEEEFANLVLDRAGLGLGSSTMNNTATTNNPAVMPS